MSDWQPELDELRRREAMAHAMGGPGKVQRQHDGGRLTVRERVQALLDPGSFHETGAIAGAAEYDDAGNLQALTASNFIFGRGRIDGQPVVVAGDDFTIRGGSADANIPAKHTQAEEMAHDLRLPMIRLVEGSGGGGSVKTIETRGRANVPAVEGFGLVFANLGVVPRVALGLGSVAGLGAADLVASHYAVMVRDTSALFVAGPPVVQRLGQDVDKQSLGGARIHTRSGAVDQIAASEQEAFAYTRRFLSYLPSSVYDLPARGPQNDDPQRRDDHLLGVVPRDRRKPYKMRRILETLLDQGSFFEMGGDFGRAIITGFARLDGWPVAVMAGDPYHYGGAWTADTCDKIIRFVDLAQTFHLPLVHLADCPGFFIGRQAEEEATIRHGARAMAAIWQARIPWCSVIVRNLFGVAGGAHQSSNRLSYRYAWPSGHWGSLPLEGGIEAAYRADLDAAPDRDAKRQEIEGRLERLQSPFRSAETFWIEEIIDPRDTRPLLCEFANLAAPLRDTGPSTWTAMRP